MPDPNGVPVRVHQIARNTGIPRPYLAKMVHMLGKAGVLETIRGRKGGVRLAKPATAFTIKDLLEIIEGPDAFTGCLLGLEECSDERACPSHEMWKPVRESLAQQLSQLTLAEARAFELTHALELQLEGCSPKKAECSAAQRPRAKGSQSRRHRPARKCGPRSA